jgi:hypothetical protein
MIKGWRLKFRKYISLGLTRASEVHLKSIITSFNLSSRGFLWKFTTTERITDWSILLSEPLAAATFFAAII